MPLTARSSGQVLPVEQKAHEILQRHRLDFPAQTLDRVAMNARQQMPFAPFFNCFARSEMTTQHIAFALQPGERLCYLCSGQRQRLGNCRERQRAERTEACADHFDQRVLEGPRLVEAGQSLLRRV